MKRGVIFGALVSFLVVSSIVGCGDSKMAKKEEHTTEKINLNEVADFVLYVKYNNEIYIQTDESKSVTEKEIEEMRGDYLGKTVYKEVVDVNEIVTDEEIVDFFEFSSNIGDNYNVYTLKSDKEKLLCEIKKGGKYEIIVFEKS